MPTRPLVSCHGCRHFWFGQIAAHGLAVIGACPHCGSELSFERASEAIEQPEAQQEAARFDAGTPAAGSPARVLGTPRSF